MFSFGGCSCIDATDWALDLELELELSSLETVITTASGSAIISFLHFHGLSVPL